MKKAIIITCILAAALSAFPAVSQRIHPVDSPIYTTIRDIYILTGHSTPSSSGPWSSAELLQMLDQIPRESVPDFLIPEYENALRQLNEDLNIKIDAVELGFSGNANLELYAHTNTDGPTRSDDNGITEKAFTGASGWSHDLVHQKPLVAMDFEFNASDFAYLFLELPFMAGFHAEAGYDHEIGNTVFGTSIPGLSTTDFNMSVNTNWPVRAFASLGSGAWNLQIGRDRLNWGSGMTGNLAISDNMPYQDMFRFATFSKSFKYTFLVLNFPHKMNFYKGGYIGSKTDDKSELQGLNMYISHRIEGRVLKDKLSFAITEAIMFSSEQGIIDFRSFNPATIFHNMYTASNSNSTLIVEIDGTPFNGFNLYAQILLDDLAVSGEHAGGPSSVGYPNAMGYLAGMRYLTGLGNGVLSLNLEGAYIDPYTYLRYKSNPEDPATEDYGIDYVVAIRDYVSSSKAVDSVVYDEYFLGYTYGGDCAVLNLNTKWRGTNGLSLSANAFFMAHGTHDKWTRWDTIGGGGEQPWNEGSVTPTTTHDTGNYRYATSDRNAASMTLDLGAHCSYRFTENVSMFGQIDFVKIWNIYNRKGVDGSDFQMVLGARYEI